MAGSVLQVAIQLPACWQVLHGLPVSWNLRTEGCARVAGVGTGRARGRGRPDLGAHRYPFSARWRARAGASEPALRPRCCRYCPSACCGTSWRRCPVGPTCRATRKAATPTSSCGGSRSLPADCVFILPSSLAFVALAPVDRAGAVPDGALRRRRYRAGRRVSQPTAWACWARLRELSVGLLRPPGHRRRKIASASLARVSARERSAPALPSPASVPKRVSMSPEIWATPARARPVPRQQHVAHPLRAEVQLTGNPCSTCQQAGN